MQLHRNGETFTKKGRGILLTRSILKGFLATQLSADLSTVISSFNIFIRVYIFVEREEYVVGESKEGSILY